MRFIDPGLLIEEGLWLPLVVFILQFLAWRCFVWRHGRKAETEHMEELDGPRSVCGFPRRLQGIRSESVESVFNEVRTGAWFLLKARVGSLFLIRRGDFKDSANVSEGIRFYWDQPRSGLEECLKGAKTYLFQPRPLLSAGGYAGTETAESEILVLGFEEWVARNRYVAKSVAGHKLFHCLQQLWRNALSREWKYHPVSSLFYEIHASVHGSPLVSFLYLLFLWPIVWYISLLESII
jgi:hypothetical protein